jgi:hypothetical protein
MRVHAEDSRECEVIDGLYVVKLTNFTSQTN